MVFIGIIHHLPTAVSKVKSVKMKMGYYFGGALTLTQYFDVKTLTGELLYLRK